MVMVIMTNVLDAAFDAILADRNLGRDAIYRPAAGDAIECRVRLVDRDDTFEGSGFGDGGLTRPVRLVRLRVADVAAPAEGDTVEIDGATYKIMNRRHHGSRRYVWSLSVGDPS